MRHERGISSVQFMYLSADCTEYYSSGPDSERAAACASISLPAGITVLILLLYKPQKVQEYRYEIFI